MHLCSRDSNIRLHGTVCIQVLAKWGPEAYLKKIDVDEYEDDVAKVSQTRGLQHGIKLH